MAKSGSLCWLNGVATVNVFQICNFVERVRQHQLKNFWLDGDPFQRTNTTIIAKMPITQFKRFLPRIIASVLDDQPSNHMRVFKRTTIFFGVAHARYIRVMLHWSICNACFSLEFAVMLHLSQVLNHFQKLAKRSSTANSTGLSTRSRSTSRASALRP